MQSLWTEFLAALRQPEYVHVLLHPLPIYGLAAGVFSLLVALIIRSRSGQAIALLLILLTAASAWLVAHFGGAAYDRVYAMSNEPAQKWLKDRQGRKLTSEDIKHYQKIIVALVETGRVMKEIDKISWTIR